jgi:hypothetical protein
MIKIIFVCVISVFLISCGKSETQNISADQYKPRTPDPSSLLPDSQKEFQLAVQSLPRVPSNVIGTREEESYTKKLTDLTNQWNSKIGSSLEDWHCTIASQDQLLGLSMNIVNCTPDGMNKDYSNITAMISTPQKLYIGDKLLVSGVINTFDINASYKILPDAPNGYRLNLKNATVKTR